MDLFPWRGFFFDNIFTLKDIIKKTLKAFDIKNIDEIDLKKYRKENITFEDISPDVFNYIIKNKYSRDLLIEEIIKENNLLFTEDQLNEISFDFIENIKEFNQEDIINILKNYTFFKNYIIKNINLNPSALEKLLNNGSWTQIKDILETVPYFIKDYLSDDFFADFIENKTVKTLIKGLFITNEEKNEFLSKNQIKMLKD